MTRITYIENTLPTVEVEHAADLLQIGHKSIYCPELQKLGLNSYDFELFERNDRKVAALRILLDRATEVNSSYYRLMVSGDISEFLNEL